MHEMVHCVNLKISINNMVIGPGYNANIYQVCLNIIKPNDYRCDVLKVVKISTTLVKVILRILNIDNCGKDDLIDIGGQIKQLFTCYCDQLKFLFVESRKNLKYVYCEDNNDRNKEWDENNYKYVGVKTDDTKYNKQKEEDDYNELIGLFYFVCCNIMYCCVHAISCTDVLKFTSHIPVSKTKSNMLAQYLILKYYLFGGKGRPKSNTNIQLLCN